MSNPDQKEVTPQGSQAEAMWALVKQANSIGNALYWLAAAFWFWIFLFVGITIWLLFLFGRQFRFP